MDVTIATWAVAVTGLMLIVLLGTFQGVAVANPRDDWTVRNVYGGDPAHTDPTAYFSHNQGYAWADVFFWAPLQIGAAIGMLLGERWGFLLGLAASVPFVYSAILIYIWDRDLEFRRNDLTYWFVWVMWPAFGVIQGLYCFVRLLE